jgi:hypothetical protein
VRAVRMFPIWQRLDFKGSPLRSECGSGKSMLFWTARREAGGTGLKLMGPPERWGAVVLAQMLKHNGHLRRDQDGLKNPQGARRRSAG